MAPVRDKECGEEMERAGDILLDMVAASIVYSIAGGGGDDIGYVPLGYDICHAADHSCVS